MIGILCSYRVLSVSPPFSTFMACIFFFMASILHKEHHLARDKRTLKKGERRGGRKRERGRWEVGGGMKRTRAHKWRKVSSKNVRDSQKEKIQ